MEHYGITISDGELIFNPSVENGTSFPVFPSTAALFFKSDEDQLYIRNAANSSWLFVATSSNDLNTQIADLEARVSALEGSP